MRERLCLGRLLIEPLTAHGARRAPGASNAPEREVRESVDRGVEQIGLALDLGVAVDLHQDVDAANVAHQAAALLCRRSNLE